MDTDNFILKELTSEIIAAVYEVHNVLGYGFLEAVYQKALIRELGSRGLKAEEQKELKVTYKGHQVGSYYADVLVNDLVLLELKAVDSLVKAHEAQILNYLKATRLRVGYLVNFGKERVEFKRFVL